MIALQIDNWNREVQEARELEEYLMKIGENLSEDLETAETLLARRERSRELAKLTLDAVISGTEHELPFTIERKNQFVDFSFVEKRSGFLSLTNSGYVGKLKRSRLDSLLFQYYYLVEDLQREEQSLNGYIEAIEASVSQTTDFSFLRYRSHFGYEITEEEKIEALREYYRQPSIRSVLTRVSVQGSVISRYQKLIATGTLLKAEIDARRR